MDIASLSTAMSTQNILNDVSVAMLSKSLDTVEDMGDGMVKIMESSVTPYLGQNIDMSMNMKLMMKEDANGDMQFVCKGTADTLGTAVPIAMFYTDGYMYVNTMGIKYRQAMDLEAAKTQATQINMDLDTDVVKGLRMYTSGDTRKLAFTIDDQKINEILTAVTSATAETYKELGVTLDMKINESNGEMTVNKDGYCEAMKMFMDYGMSVTDPKLMR